MNKRIIIVAIIAVVLVLIGAAVFFIASNRGASSAPGSGTTGTLPPVVIATSTYNPPTGPTLTLGTPDGSVTMNNFYNNPVQVSADHAAVTIAQTDAYSILYYPSDSSFNIFIQETPFATFRAEAETAFLQALGISQADACKLKVVLGTSIEVDPADGGQNFGLSFCTAGVFQSP